MFTYRDAARRCLDDAKEMYYLHGCVLMDVAPMLLKLYSALKNGINLLQEASGVEVTKSGDVVGSVLPLMETYPDLTETFERIIGMHQQWNDWACGYHVASPNDVEAGIASVESILDFSSHLVTHGDDVN